MRSKTLLVLLTACIVVSVGIAQGEGLNGAIRPISNFVYLDSPDVGTSVHPVFVYHEFPSRVSTAIDGVPKVPLGGDLLLYALQLEYAFNDTLSLIAVKDGWIDFNPDNTEPGMFTEQEGWADLAAGLKWVCYKDEDAGFVSSLRLVAEIPIGDDKVWQGNGDGMLDPAVSFMKLAGRVQFLGTVGYIYALDNDESSSSLYDAWHLSYNINDRVFPLVELNHFLVTDNGSGPRQFTRQVDGAVPAVAQFEGPDLVNLGAANAKDNEHQVTLALGSRLRLSDSVDVGAAYELPLTDEEDGLTDSRVTVDLVWSL